MIHFMDKVLSYFLIFYGGMIFGCLMMASVEKEHSVKKAIAILAIGLAFSAVFVVVGILFGNK